MRKRLFPIICILVLTLTACNGSTSSSSQDYVKVNSAGKDANEQTGDPNKTDNSKAVKSETSSKEINAQGIVVEINKSIFSLKININGTEQWFALSPKFQGAIEALNIKNGDTIAFTYTENNNKLVISDIGPIQSVGNANSQSKSAGLGLLPKKPAVYDYDFVYTNNRNLLIRYSYLFTGDGYAQVKFDHEDSSKTDGSFLKPSLIFYYEDESGYYKVIDVEKNLDPSLNHIDKVKNNKKQLLIEYPVKVGSEVAYEEDGKSYKWKVEEYPLVIQDFFIMSEKANEIIKVGIYKDGKKTAEWYMMPGLGAVKQTMPDFPKQPVTLKKITDIK